MGEFFVTILVFFGVITLTAFVFLIWAIARVGGWVGRAFTGTFAGPRCAPAGRITAMPGQPCPCPRPNCRALNDPTATYCRRCGQTMPHAQRVIARRVA